jgi:hypothetical protein
MGRKAVPSGHFFPRSSDADGAVQTTQEPKAEKVNGHQTRLRFVVPMRNDAARGDATRTKRHANTRFEEAEK